MKGKNDAGNMEIKLKAVEMEIDSLNILYDIVTIYLGEKSVPMFKQKKLTIYAKIIQQFNVMQINNAHQVASFWSQIIANPNIKAADDGGVE